MSMDFARPRADLDLRARLEQVAQEVCSAIPEIEAVGFVVTWKFPIQPMINPGLVFGAEGDLINLGGHMRLGRELLRLLEHTNAEIRRLMLVQEQLANQLAKDVYVAKTTLGEARRPQGSEETPPETATPQRMEGTS